MINKTHLSIPADSFNAHSTAVSFVFNFAKHRDNVAALYGKAKTQYAARPISWCYVLRNTEIFTLIGAFDESKR